MFTVNQLHFELGPDSHSSPRTAAVVSKCPFNRFMQSLSQVELSGGGLKLMSVISWIRSFVAKPNSSVGRQGAVCPFMARAIDSGSIFFKSIHLSSSDKDSLDELVKSYAEVFFETEPTAGKARLNKAIVLMFPDIAESGAKELIEETQRRLKPYFVERGLMLGEFHRHHQGEGIHNKDFRPLQSPVPLLIVRHLIPSDLIFLNRQSDSASRQVHFIGSYLRLFQNQLPSRLHEQALKSYKRALREMSLELSA